MSKPKIGIIVSSVREVRFADKVLAWLKPITDARTDLDFEIVDLRDYKLPFFDEAMSPAYKPEADDEVAKKWQAKIDSLDGYVFLVAEYNRSITGALKNAIDWAYPQWNRKPAAYIGYGSVGGARAIEQLRNISVELQLTPVRHGVHIGGADFIGVFMQGRDLSEFPYYVDNANETFDHLAWWANALKTAREADSRAEAA